MVELSSFCGSVLVDRVDEIVEEVDEIVEVVEAVVCVTVEDCVCEFVVEEDAEVVEEDD